MTQSGGKTSFSGVVSRVFPAVVSLNTKVTVEADPAEMFGPFMFQGPPRRVEREALGSGVILTSRGLIVTNDHVIDKADKIKVTTSDELTFDAEVVIRDSLHDLAIIKILTGDEEEEDDDDDDDDDDVDDVDDEEEETNNNKNKSNRNINNNNKTNIISSDDNYSGILFPYIKFGKCELTRVGDIVLAIGNNLGFRGTVTDGIISAIGRTNEKSLKISYPQFPLIQTNASINGGSSGGALVNMSGELIGVNESIATTTGGNVGVGFAVPSNFVIPLLRSAKKGGFDPDRVWDGISCNNCPYILLNNDSDIKSKLNKIYNNKTLIRLPPSNLKRVYPRGVMIKNIHSKSPGHKSGLLRGDIIFRVNNIGIDNINDYYLFIAGTAPNTLCKYHILRPKNKKNRKKYIMQNNKSGKTHINKNNNNNNNIRYLDNIYLTHKYIVLNVKILNIPLPNCKPLEIKDRINPFYGSTLTELSPAICADFGLDYSQQGVIIYDIDFHSQCFKLGFRVGDIIIQIDNKRVKKLKDVESMGETLQHRKNCRIKFKRNNKIHHVDVYLRTRRRYYSRL